MQTSSGTKVRSGRGKVVLIDDSQIVLDMARMTLEGQGFTVVTLDSPIGASIVTARERPDLVLVDVAMASMSGEQVVKNLKARAKGQDMRVFLFSDRSEPELRAAAQRCGADGWLRKSADPEAFIAAIDGILSPAA